MERLRYFSEVLTLELIQDKCNNCGMCVKVCPHEVFEIIEKKVRITGRDYCMECGACALNCQVKAITVNSGVGCAAGIISGILNNSEPTCGCSDSKSNCC